MDEIFAHSVRIPSVGLGRTSEGMVILLGMINEEDHKVVVSLQLDNAEIAAKEILNHIRMANSYRNN